ncbi:protein adenylyltransferase SelO [Leucobacter massiliensis]|uniref:Protein nucleotidyltransferase YdiU n=1 Tax=Leucobacter massiliensis TaxID=1686285 RepID=A0A2S9QP93_9MICO|nr:YdiU family protein [Leucobacter massiliensis]PRI11409.1 hypothetical protein B4915_06095 [Leucobacter massiliensis]
MSSAPSSAPPRLGADYASRFPELTVPWRAAAFPSPEIVELGEDLARELGLDPAWLRSDDGVRFLTGAELPAGAAPVAQAYAGHQFGGYVPRLGDGRALLLGELTDRAGRIRELHLKGSGPTPFARGGDGFAALGPMLREHLMGEAMHALGVPSSRALAVLRTGARIHRPEALDPLPGAMLVRVASSHLRVGTFQFARSLDDPALLRRLADAAIERHAPELLGADRRYLGLLDAVIATQAELLAAWMLVGFVHGVMNTDNTTISGETLDYGPCAFIDAYEPAAVFSSIDHGGRYAYGNQPSIALWNLTRFAESLLPLIAAEARDTGGAEEDAESLALAALDRFPQRYGEEWGRGMRAKLGVERAGVLGDEALADVAGAMLAEWRDRGVDFTSGFVALGAAADGDGSAYRELLGGVPGEWFDRWLALRPDAARMAAVNPLRIPRNHLVDEALEAATAGDHAPYERLLEAVSHPFGPLPGFERYERAAPAGSRPHVTFCGT